ncbi:hypothetical protein JW979_16335 [bacterium]|nr:hypothetical protein [candidate division CSSED10-310 bacterium]
MNIKFSGDSAIMLGSDQSGIVSFRASRHLKLFVWIIYLLSIFFYPLSITNAHNLQDPNGNTISQDAITSGGAVIMQGGFTMDGAVGLTAGDSSWLSGSQLFHGFPGPLFVTSTPTETPTETPTNTPTSTPTATQTETPTATQTETPTATTTFTPTETPTSMTTETPTEMPTETSVPGTPTPSPTLGPIPTTGPIGLSFLIIMLSGILGFSVIRRKN